jgi:hypothetical protein
MVDCGFFLGDGEFSPAECEREKCRRGLIFVIDIVA